MKWERIGGPIPSHGKRKLRLNNGCGPRIGRRQDATRTKRRSKQQSRAGAVRADLTAPQNKARLRLSLPCCACHALAPYSCHGSSYSRKTTGPQTDLTDQTDMSTRRWGPRTITTRALSRWVVGLPLPLFVSDSLEIPRTSAPVKDGQPLPP